MEIGTGGRSYHKMVQGERLDITPAPHFIVKNNAKNIFNKKNQKKVGISLVIEKKYVSLHRISVFRPKKLTINNNENK